MPAPAATVVLVEAKEVARRLSTATLLRHERRLHGRFPDLSATGKTYWLAAREVLLVERGVRLPTVGRHE
jgi:hypothetical protein